MNIYNCILHTENFFLTMSFKNLGEMILKNPLKLNFKSWKKANIQFIHLLFQDARIYQMHLSQVWQYELFLGF